MNESKLHTVDACKGSKVENMRSNAKQRCAVVLAGCIRTKLELQEIAMAQFGEAGAWLLRMLPPTCKILCNLFAFRH